ncbi:hypothetical protein [Guptibacillus hwajinpoensis]|uniref:Multidrug ABC transporter ATPase n=1 Tax=Guptibacillus hwajinpoensis TaxID=208199 RepID=A0ABU0K600_9BACL|nr:MULTISPECIES: hypothetical protein [Alkalihalobacillus]MDP4551684.1 hypothetical protein [Alkalihalobacillus macyae]MDQ0484724.1 hypothetical protein [Alkalihalobacillus hemicentroti]
MANRKEKPENSSMAMDEEEMKELGKEMEKLDTNEKVKEKGRRPDPKQHETNDRKE